MSFSLNSEDVQVYGVEKLHEALHGRPKGKALLTVNGMSLLQHITLMRIIGSLGCRHAATKSKDLQLCF